METIHAYSSSTLKARIKKALAKAEYGLEVKYLIEATGAEFSYFNFCEALGELQQEGKVAYNEDTESYIIVR